MQLPFNSLQVFTEAISCSSRLPGHRVKNAVSATSAFRSVPFLPWGVFLSADPVAESPSQSFLAQNNGFLLVTILSHNGLS